MTTGHDRDAIPDALLTGYLDGELDPATREEVEASLRDAPDARERLAELDRGGSPIRAVLDAVLDAAPRERLAGLLAAAAAQSRPRPAPRRAAEPSRALLALAACLLLVLGGAIGFVAGRGPAALIGGLPASERWQRAVAEQVSLYSPASLAAIEVVPGEQQARLVRLGAELNIALTPQAVDLPGLALKRADLLQVAGQPLIQLLYDGGALGPVALCIMREREAEAPDRTTRRVAGMNLVYWQAAGRGFLVVGSAPAEKIRDLATIAASRFAS